MAVRTHLSAILDFWVRSDGQLEGCRCPVEMLHLLPVVSICRVFG